MNQIPFQAGGPLPGDSSVYICRDADAKAKEYLFRMDYITLIESRQSGKTSLINHLIQLYSDSGFVFARRDLIAERSKSENQWYTSLGRWILRQLYFIPSNKVPILPIDAESWEEFLAHIAASAELLEKKIVIVLDEIGAMPPSIATDFFSVLRSIYSSRDSLKFWKHLTFIIAGVFNPRNLIKDESISDWNVDQRIDLSDFTESQTKTLVGKLHYSLDIINSIADRIFYWTDGQPFLTQKSCYYIAENKDMLEQLGIDKIVDDSIEEIFRNDMNHLSRINAIKNDAHLSQIVKKLIQRKTRLTITLNHQHFYLTKINGILKADSQGICMIRNRIYEQALEKKDLKSFTRFKYDVFISYSSKDRMWVHNKLLVELEKECLRVCIDIRDFKPGLPVLKNIESAIRDSKKTLIILSPYWLKSKWAEFESLLVQTKDPAARRQRMIPLKLKPCKLPNRLEYITFIDFTKPTNFEKNMKKLVKAVIE